MPNKPSDDNAEPEIDFIPVIEEVLHNEMFLVAVAIGAIIGAIAIHLYLSRDGKGFSFPSRVIDQTPEEPEYIDAAPTQQPDDITSNWPNG